MGKLILVLFLALSKNANAASGSGNISNIITSGGVSNADSLNIAEENSQGYFSVYTGNGVTGGNVTRLIKNGVAYQVTAAKTFKIVKMCVSSTSASPQVNLVTATAAIGADVTTGSLTGAVYSGGAAGGYSFEGSTSTHTYLCHDILYSMAASTYAGVQVNVANTYVVLLGKEI